MSHSGPPRGPYGMRFALHVLFAALLSSACTQSETLLVRDASTSEERDAGLDAGPRDDPDASSDAGPAPRTWGSSCASDADCAGLCRRRPGCEAYCGPFDRCWASCDGPGDCPEPDAQTCISLEGELYCALNCDIADEDPCGPPGLGCGELYPELGICGPGCSEDSDCSDGRLCQRNRRAGECLRIGARIGDPCRSRGESDCGDEQWCWRFDPESEDGICVGDLCTPGTDLCQRYFDPDSACANVQRSEVTVGACVPRCGPSDPCPEGLTCSDQDGTHVCIRL